jgi:glycolate oxidase
MQLLELIPGLQLIHEHDDLRPFECDGLAACRMKPMLAFCQTISNSWKSF